MSDVKKRTVDNDLRKRENSGATAPKAKKKRDDDEIDERGRTKLNFFLLLLILGVPLLTGLVFAFEYIAHTSFGRSLGLSLSPRDRLEAFYLKHNPEKLKSPVFLDKTLRKWQGREEVLFKILERKYSEEDD